MDWTTILTALATAIPPTIAALAAFWKIKSLHVEINSRMTELLRVTEAVGFSKGVTQERADAKDRT